MSSYRNRNSLLPLAQRLSDYMPSVNRISLLPFIIAVLLFAGCASQPSPKQSNVSASWVESTLKRLTLEEKIGQMIMSRAYGYYYSSESDEFHHIEHSVR